MLVGLKETKAVPDAVTYPPHTRFGVRLKIFYLQIFSTKYFTIVAAMPTDALGPAVVKHKKSKKDKVIDTNLGLTDLSHKEKRKKHKANSLSHELSISK